MNTKRRTTACVLNYQRGLIDFQNSSFYEGTPVDEFMLNDHPNADGTTSTTLCSEIYMLFNQQRLDKLTNEALINRLERIKSSAPVSNMRENLTDDQICEMVKSRYIQTPSELMAYYSSLSRQVDNLSTELQQAISEKQAAVSNKEQPAAPAVDIPAAPVVTNVSSNVVN